MKNSQVTTDEIVKLQEASAEKSRLAGETEKRNADKYRAEMRRIEQEQKRHHDNIMNDYRAKLDKYAKEAEADKKEAKRQMDEMRKHNEDKEEKLRKRHTDDIKELDGKARKAEERRDKNKTELLEDLSKQRIEMTQRHEKEKSDMEARMQKEEARHEEFITQLDLQMSKEETDHKEIMGEIKGQIVQVEAQHNELLDQRAKRHNEDKGTAIAIQAQLGAHTTNETFNTRISKAKLYGNKVLRETADIRRQVESFVDEMKEKKPNNKKLEKHRAAFKYSAKQLYDSIDVQKSLIVTDKDNLSRSSVDPEKVKPAAKLIRDYLELLGKLQNILTNVQYQVIFTDAQNRVRLADVQDRVRVANVQNQDPTPSTIDTFKNIEKEIDELNDRPMSLLPSQLNAVSETALQASMNQMNLGSNQRNMIENGQNTSGQSSSNAIRDQ
ncbi:hypothetical protein WR25_18748 isoform I [Diploscapter pachys]|nr:hypothetical protein WR25_18748 isoform B [Diploscapter pachys]PAV76942.1 hypothetical protein WR25_18748 isoform F [Diploscapter pachys]PAV76943.1 hypothetical protein WR25_18748 isoform G [Diploscapter pachys]PAV76945.1 hypothetical protein WR25_18748 isoform I [Diploscapter pachys]